MEENKIDIDNNNNKSSSKLKNFFYYNSFDAKKSVTSWFISPKILLIIRGIIFLYSWIVLIGQIVKSGLVFFKYYTNLSFIGLTIYFTTAFYHSCRYVTSNNTTISFQNQPKILNWLFWVLYHTLAHFPIFVVLAYWILLSKVFLSQSVSPFMWWLNISVHGINSLFAMIEIILNRQVMVPSFVILNLIIQILYTFVAWINYAATSQWLYGFLNWSNGLKSAISYIGLFVAYVIIFFIMYGLHLLRDYVGKKLGCYKDDDVSLPT